MKMLRLHTRGTIATVATGRFFFMDYDDNQTLVPDSFVELYRDTRQRLNVTRKEVARRYEFCEDMAQMLVDTCRTIHFRDGVAEEEVLDRVLRGLADGAPGIEPMHAVWVVRRAAELLEWRWMPPQVKEE